MAAFGAASIAVVFAFQNCSRVQVAGRDQASETQYNGHAYEGKVYSHKAPSACADGQSAQAQIRILSLESAELIRENCQNLNPSVLLGFDQFSIDPSNPDIVIYDNRTFVSDTPFANAIYHKSTVVGVPGPLINTQISTGIGNFQTNPSARDLMVCQIQICDTGVQRSITAVSDNYGNQFTRGGSLYRSQQSAPNLCTSELWYAADLVAGLNSYNVTATYDGPANSGQVIVCANFATDTGRALVLDSVHAHFGPFGNPVAIDTVIDVPVPSSPMLVVGGVWASGLLTPGADGFTLLGQPSGDIYSYKVIYSGASAPVRAQTEDGFVTIYATFR